VLHFSVVAVTVMVLLK